MENKTGLNDVLGIAPYGEAIKILVEKSVDGVGQLLGKLIFPFVEEYGLALRDKARVRRLNRLIEILEKANGKFGLSDDLTGINVHPRIVKELFESATWCEDQLLQELWAGLLVSSFETGEVKGKNLLFVESLKKLTSTQARIIEYACKNCKVMLYDSGLILASKLIIPHELMISITAEADVFQLDAEIDSLRAQELISSGGYNVRKIPLIAEFCPSALALNLYAKTQGHKGKLSDFYKTQITDKDDPDFKQVTLLSV